MGEKCQWCSLMCAICRIGCFRCGQKLCCKEPSAPRPTYSVIAIGLSQAGKSHLFASLTGDTVDDLKPTVGFSVKAIQLPTAILNIKELGGRDNVRKYWPHYYAGSLGIVFVVDSNSNDDDVDLAAAELQEALSHPALDSLPLLVFANKQDAEGACSVDELSRMMGLDVIARNREWHIQPCSKDDVESARQGLSKLVTFMNPDKETTEQNQI
ncbi:ADP-ribosylation factor-like protein 15 [Desmophyllum pertusum]|uniref:ADP-ribosylation factor-like protein 15 n=1 Tax=Desmophyllum pertusum TaxID=174260 RepID=A0A9W9YTM6_9CNID|nr:ADP-ribosylation factor-like protein 15 [Desmophyllum pertusum]